jgi:Protein of unknown function (DUF3303)
VRYMVVEQFGEGRAGDVYRRFAEKGRMLPEGLHHIDSWVAADLCTCYQLMETDEFGLFAQWTRHWEDLVEFEIVPIIPSPEARAKALSIH